MRATFALLLLFGCAHAPPAKTISGFRLDVAPAEAELTVDGQVLGALSSLPLKEGVLELSPGVHQMSLKLKGYQTWRAEVSLGSQVEPLKVSLVKR